MVLLTATALLTWNPGTALHVKLKQSQAYWRGAAHPLAVLDAKVYPNGTLAMKIQNNAVESVTLSSASVSGTAYPLSPHIYLSPGAGIIIAVPANISSPIGMCEFPLSFTYGTAAFGSLVQAGARDFMVVCPGEIDPRYGCAYSEGQSGCASELQCCSQNDTCLFSTCCRYEGTACTAGSQCCSGSCISSSCACTANDQNCGSASECCQSGGVQACESKCCHPEFTGNLSAASPNCCSPTQPFSSAVTGKKICCKSSTTQGKPSCSSDDDCCYDSTTGIHVSVCQDGHCCNVAGETCSSNSHCCSNNCAGNVCT